MNIAASGALVFSTRYSGDTATDHSYYLSHILQFCVSLDVNTSNMHTLCDYEIQRLLRTMQNTAPGFDGLPCWLFKRCSYELAGIVTTILNMSFQFGIVGYLWNG